MRPLRIEIDNKRIFILERDGEVQTRERGRRVALERIASTVEDGYGELIVVVAAPVFNPRWLLLFLVNDGGQPLALTVDGRRGDRSSDSSPRETWTAKSREHQREADVYPHDLSLPELGRGENANGGPREFRIAQKRLHESASRRVSQIADAVASIRRIEPMPRWTTRCGAEPKGVRARYVDPKEMAAGRQSAEGCAAHSSISSAGK